MKFVSPYAFITAIVFLCCSPLAVISYPTSYADDEIIIIKEFLPANKSAILCDKTSNDAINNEDELIIAIEATESIEEELFTTTDTARLYIDLSAFLALIPSDKFKSIVSVYYQRDVEVQHTYNYLQSVEYAQLQQQLLNTMEMLQLLRFFNNSGVQLLKLVHTITAYLKLPSSVKLLPNAAESTLPTGMLGLTETLLETLPQDVILTTFFDKLEHDEEFYRLVNHIGSSEFAQICQQLQQSEELSNYMYTLKSNGIDLMSILSKLKDYFFMGTF